MENEVAAELTQRWNGPFSLRLLLQPTMAALFALRDGKRDAMSGSDPYLSRLVFKRSERRETLASAWASVGKVLLIAIVLDCAFQVVTDGRFSLVQAGGIALILCAPPYTILRGPAARWFGR